MSEDVSVRTPSDATLLSWAHVVEDASVGLIDLDGHGTGALMNDAARELLHVMRRSAAGSEDGPVVGTQVAPREAADQAAAYDDEPVRAIDPADLGSLPRLAETAPGRGPLTFRGDVTELLWRYAPVMAGIIREEGRGASTGQQSGPPGPLGPSRVVSCTSPMGQRWVRIDAYRRSHNRFLVTLVDVTGLQRDTEQADALDWELADTVAQRLVTAETALDLGRDELGRRLIAEARALIRARIGEHVRRSGGAGPGLMRRQVLPPEGPPPPSTGAST